MTFELATVSSVRPVIGLYGESGSGKTHSGLLLARGMAGPNGKVCMIDTEYGKGGAFANVIPQGYLRDDLLAPWTPERFVAKIEEAERLGADVIVIDSASLEWEGEGGVRDQAAKIEEAQVAKGKSGGGLHPWNKPKAAHLKFILKLMHPLVPLVVCIRASHRSRQVKVGGKTEIIRDEHPTPIQARDFIFEMTAHAIIEHGSHNLRVTKSITPDFEAVLRHGHPITLETGERLAAWCSQDIDGALETGRDMAKLGAEHLKNWWTSLTPDQQRRYRTEKDGLKKAIAAQTASSPSPSEPPGEAPEEEAPEVPVEPEELSPALVADLKGIFWSIDNIEILEAKRDEIILRLDAAPWPQRKLVGELFQERRKELT